MTLSKSYKPTDENNDVVNTALVKDKLIEKICNDTDIPSIGDSISRIVRQSASGKEPIKKLADLILSDTALTQKILRISNSASICTSSEQEVTSISVAIQLLGLDEIKICALAVILVDSMSNNKAQCVRVELAHALTASTVACKLAKQSNFKNIEEVTIVALFKNMGRLLVAAYDPNLYLQIMTLVKQDKQTLSQASTQILGFNFDKLTENAMQKWKIPATIIKAMKIMPSKVLTPPKTRLEWMQQAADFSESVTLQIIETDAKEKESLNQSLLERFRKPLNLDKTELKNLITHTTQASGSLIKNTQLTLHANIQKNIDTDCSNIIVDMDSYPSLPNELSSIHNNTQKTQNSSHGKPSNALALLATGLQKLAKLVSGSFNFNDLVKLVLETLHAGLSARFTTFCLKDTKANQFQARTSLGVDHSIYQQTFVFSAVPTDDLFHLALKKNIDLLISDTSSQKIRSLIPHWHSQLLPDACSLIILPLVIENRPIGLFYIDSKKSFEGINSKEMALLKALKHQVLVALSPK